MRVILKLIPCGTTTESVSSTGSSYGSLLLMTICGPWDLCLHSNHDFLRVLCRALREMLEEAARPPRGAGVGGLLGLGSGTSEPLIPSPLRASRRPWPVDSMDQPQDERHESVSVNHLILQHRRYSHVIADIKFVLNIEGVAQEFLRQCLADWLKV